MTGRNTNVSYADLLRLRRELADRDFMRDNPRPEPVAGGSLWGIPVIESPLLTKTILVTHQRTWRERLCSWPWRPWVKEFTTSHVVPSDEVFVINCDGVFMDIDPPLGPFPKRITGRVTLAMHPQAAAIIKDLTP